MNLQQLRDKWLPVLKGNPTRLDALKFEVDANLYKTINPKWEEETQ